MTPTTTTTPETRSFTTLFRAEIARYEPRYAARRVEHPIFDAHATLGGLVAWLAAKLKDPTPEQRRERGVVLGALVRVYQESGDRLWETALLGACMPMVQTVRTRFHGGDADDREGELLAELARVLRAVDPGQVKPELLRTVIWRKAKKRLVRQLTREHEWEETGFGVEADTVPSDAPLLGPPDQDAASAEPRAERGDLRKQVDRTCAHLSKAERDVVYRRLVKRRQRKAARARGKIQLTVIRRRRGAPTLLVGMERKMTGTVDCVLSEPAAEGIGRVKGTKTARESATSEARIHP